MVKDILISWCLLVLLVCIPLHGDAGTDGTDAMEKYNQILKLVGQKEYPAAITGLKALIKTNPGFHRSYKKIALCYFNKKDSTAGIAFFTGMHNKYPHNPYYTYGLAFSYFKNREYPQAIRFYKKTISQKPTLTEAYDQLVDAHLKIKTDRKKKRKEVEEYLKKRIEKDERNASAHYGLGYFYHQIRAYRKQGLSILNKVIEMEPGMYQAYHARGVINW
ncbi:MAG: tetratricopeptide repeat protein [bacterium]|nr:tetratricopeptide repeat protein [bacterium]